jgi:alcohol dehydrogenase YqhD (iron-dependent ADH family)
VIFGEKSEEQVAALVKKYGGTKVLVHYGGQSAVKSGLLDKVCGDLCRKEGVDYKMARG